MSTFDESLVLRDRRGRFAGRLPAPPAAALVEPLEPRAGATQSGGVTDVETVSSSDPGSDYYTTIEPTGDGTYVVTQCTYPPVPPFGTSRHRQATGLSRTEAETRAREWADFRPSAPRPRRVYCHWCGILTHRVGSSYYCDECGEQW